MARMKNKATTMQKSTIDQSCSVGVLRAVIGGGLRFSFHQFSHQLNFGRKNGPKSALFVVLLGKLNGVHGEILMIFWVKEFGQKPKDFIKNPMAEPPECNFQCPEWIEMLSDCLNAGQCCGSRGFSESFVASIITVNENLVLGSEKIGKYEFLIKRMDLDYCDATWEDSCRGEIVNIIGDYDPGLMKFFDFTCSTLQTDFDGNVMYQFETMEYILDYAFERLSIEAFGIDATFSYKYNQQLGKSDSDGLVVCLGLTTSHVIPVIKGELVVEACCRTNVCGYYVTDYMKRLLALQYPNHVGSKKAEEKTKYWQLPWVPSLPEEEPTEEELARKADIKEKQGQRLCEMAAAKLSSRIADLESEVQGLERLLQQLDGLDDIEKDSFLMENGYCSRHEIEVSYAKAMAALRKAKGEPIEVEKERYPLINIPNSMLTSKQLKDKKKQLFLKTTSDGRARAKQKCQEEKMQRERENQQDEERHLENPELYLKQLCAKQADLVAKVEQRKRLKTSGLPRANNNINATGGVGRSERLNVA
eukprot:Gb_24010 [translate_table: standard]